MKVSEKKFKKIKTKIIKKNRVLHTPPYSADAIRKLELLIMVDSDFLKIFQSINKLVVLKNTKT